MSEFMKRIKIVFKGLGQNRFLRLIQQEPTLWYSFTLVRKVIVFLVGVSVLMVGIVLIFTPGPAFVVIPLGLSILGMEFIWARRILKYAKRGAGKGFSRFWQSIKKKFKVKEDSQRSR